jgi:beta-glucosidase
VLIARTSDAPLKYKDPHFSVKHLSGAVAVPIRALQGFKRINLKRGGTETVSFTLTPRELSSIDNASSRVVLPGEFEITVGGQQPGAAGLGSQVLAARLKMTGEAYEVK